MTYEKPEFVEIKMDAEIGSYQGDYEPARVAAELAPEPLEVDAD